MEHVWHQIRGGMAIITLDRPQALNALTLEMIEELLRLIDIFEKTEAVKAVCFIGAGDRAFCAGGDVKAFHKAGLDFKNGACSLEEASRFFTREYAMNARISHYSKPTIAFMNGITMGGGYGIAGNCRFRVAMPATRFAMPEVRIGFFPDVGSAYHLIRMKHRLGVYAALCAMELSGFDCFLAGAADYYVVHNFQSLLSVLSDTDLSPHSVECVLSLAHQDQKSNIFSENVLNNIENVFCDYNLLAICKRLQNLDYEWSKQCLDALQTHSPTSLFVTAKRLEISQEQTFQEGIDQDLILVRNFLQMEDLYEGIRAAIIDKDKNPVWRPRSLKEIVKSDIKKYF